MELIKYEQVFNRNFFKEGAFYKLTHKPSGKSCMATIKFLSDGKMQMTQGGCGNEVLITTTDTPQSFLEFLKEEELEIELFKEEYEVYDILQEYEEQEVKNDKPQKFKFVNACMVDSNEHIITYKLINVEMISSIEIYKKGLS